MLTDKAFDVEEALKYRGNEQERDRGEYAYAYFEPRQQGKRADDGYYRTESDPRGSRTLFNSEQRRKRRADIIVDPAVKA